MTEEIWKSVCGYEDSYEISSLGNLRGKERALIYKDGRKGVLKPMPLKGSLQKTGYYAHNFKGERKLIHRVVAETFLGKPIFRMTVNHKNGIKTDNRLENLEWATFKENNDHARDTGLNKQHGNNTNLTKFSEQLVHAMKKVKEKYNTPVKELADLFNISTSHVYEILRGTTRKRN
jgi:hypothetical protein